MTKSKRVRGEDYDSVECFLDEGRLYVYIDHSVARNCGYLGASFTAAEIPALRKWAKALLKMCDDKSMEVE